MEQRGLSEADVLERRALYGLNELRDIGSVSVLTVLFRQIRGNFMIYLLVAAAILSFWVEKGVTGYTLLFIVGLVIVIGFFQEYRAERAISALKHLIAPVSIVIREGKQQEILSRDLVPGDIVVLRMGERVPADCLILEASDVQVDESVITGESGEIAKLKAPSLSATDSKHFLYMGSYLVRGRSIAQVSAVGMKTKFGSIASMISLEEKSLPLQGKINRLSVYTVIIALFFSVLVGVIQFFRISSFSPSVLVDLALIVIALAVSAFPESFPVVLLTTLSAGAHRMVRQNAIVNRMSVIETLGETTVICSDKTGTLTKGEMTAKQVLADGKMFSVSGAGYEEGGSFFLDSDQVSVPSHPVLRKLCEAAVLCNDASITHAEGGVSYKVLGTPTESALLIMAAKGSLHAQDIKAQRVAEVPFSSERKLMSVLIKQGRESLVYVKGAPEIVLSRCTRIQRANGSFTLTRKERESLLKQVASFNTQAYRTLALAYKPHGSLKGAYEEKELILLGIVALEDPPREEVVEALQQCTRAGIAVKMITGDHRETALSIAAQIGLSGEVLTGAELDTLSDAVLEERVQNTVIFARVRPEHKFRIVNALKARGEIVTMTGDGVNDAPALKASHIGVAMGKSGTDVSRSVADITLKDDNFATIVKAVREGRTIFNNMRKFVTYQFSCNYAEIMVLFLAVLFAFPIPLVAIHILFMNLVTDDIPAVTLGLNPSSDDVMAQPPRRKKGILSKDHLAMIIMAGTIMGGGTLGVFMLMLHQGSSIYVARTTALVCLILFEITGAFSFRSLRKGTLTSSPFTNKYLIYASIISLAATLLIIYTPLNVPFETVPLTGYAWLLAAAPSVFLVAIMDLLKGLNSRLGFWKEVN